MGFLGYLKYHVVTMAVLAVSALLMITGLFIATSGEVLIGGALIVIALIGAVWVRYRDREQEIRTSQRKIGQR